MSVIDRTNCYCVIGAGGCGLVAAKNLLQAGLQVEVLERHADLGGNWNYALPCSHVYRSTHMISSKEFTQFPDFPMPEEFPDYPHHTQVLDYLRRYAREFGVDEVIAYEQPAQRVAPWHDGSAWDVTVAGGAARRYAGVIIANGHHWSPKWPEYAGEFSGTVMHSADYKTPEKLEGRRVLVVGGGNSGCDIAVEAAQNGARVFHSTRRGYYYIPKYILGAPADAAGDRLHKMRIPLWLRRTITRALLKVTVGDLTRFGVKRPDHKLFESHPVVNSLLLYYLQHGDIHPRQDIERLEGSRVRFVDGGVEEIDVIVYATGYNLEFPFIDRELLNWRDGRPRLYKHIFHPRFDNLFLAGMIQPDSGIFSLVYWQARAISLFLAAQHRNDQPTVEYLRRLKQDAGEEDFGAGIHYQPTAHHALEVEHWRYLHDLRRLNRKLKRTAGAVG